MRPGRADVVAEQLLELVLDGTFPVGGALPSESELAALFGVSRLTVREAIRSLVPTRVLDVQQGRSTLVNPTSRWSPLDGRLLLARSRVDGDPLLLSRRLMEARRAVELAIVELAAARRQDQHLERLRVLHEQMLEGHTRGDAVATAEADFAFHAALFEAADNVFLDALFEPLTSVLRVMRRETSAVPDFRSHAIDRHAAILRAVEGGDPLQARAAMEAHLQQTEEDVERFLGTDGDQAKETPTTSSSV